MSAGNAILVFIEDYPAGVWTALYARYRNHGFAAWRSMKAMASSVNRSVVYPSSFCALATAIEHVERIPVAELGRDVLMQDEIMGADQETEEIVEAARLRMIRGIEPFVPFANQSGRIACRSQMIGERRLIQWQAEPGRIALVRIELVAKLGLVTSGEHSGTRRTAVRCRDVTVGAADPGREQGIDIWRRHQLAAVDSDVGIASKIIRDDYQDVRFVRGGR